jgi:glycosyltransferase involved in cell wall biosynthesis
MTFPFVTVIIRSYRRIPQMLELLEAVRAQDYPNFEIVVIEQTQDGRQAYQQQFEEARRDPRVRILEFPPLGPAPARNEAVHHAHGEILLFMDDDDLPLHSDWISCHAANYADPKCVAVSGREVRERDEDPTPHNTEANYRQCLRYTWLKMPRARVRHTRRIEGVDLVRGGNASLRKDAIERAGGWDDERHGEENSFDFRFEQCRRTGEYFAYDPTAVFLRRLDLEGGSERRLVPPSEVLRAELSYSHRVVRRYFPWRFALCYPAYLWLGFLRAYEHLAEFGEQATPVWRARSVLLVYPRVLGEVWRGALATPMRPLRGAIGP